MSVVSEIGWNRPCSLEYIISKNEKSVVFYFKSFGPWMGFGFCGLILSLVALRECNSFFLFFKQQYSRKFIKLVLVTPTHACSKTCDFTIFLVLLKNDFSWNWAIRIGELVSTFRCWKFSPSSFLHKKNTTKKLIFLCVSVTDMNSFKKAIDFQVFWNSWQFVAASWCKDMEWNYTQKCMVLKRAKIIEKIMILLRVKKPY